MRYTKNFNGKVRLNSLYKNFALLAVLNVQKNFCSNVDLASQEKTGSEMIGKV